MLEKLTSGFAKLLADQRKILRLFALGALIFFIGIGFIQWADKMLEPSLQQEGYMLLAMISCAVGFSISMLAQCLLIIYRFKKMGKKDL
jgi:hypothetical protein